MKRRHRKWKAKVRPVEQPIIQSWEVVLAELRVGTASVGIRFNKEDDVHFFAMHKTPTESATIVRDIALGILTLRDIANYDWQAVTMPHKYMEGIDHEKEG